MKILPSPSLPSLKVQRLNVLNKLSTIKGSCIGLNSKDDGPEPNNEQPVEQRNELERRTVDSKHISTVSSLVADDRESTNGKESQRNNFGLYALKFQRNVTTHANTMLMMIKRDNCKNAKASKSDEPSATDAPKRSKTVKHRSKHEQFEPCDRGHANYNDANEHYDDEFDEGCSVDVWTNRNQRFNNNMEHTIAGPNARAPIRPRRLKPIAPKANSIAAHDMNKTPKNDFNHQYMAYESIQSMERFDSDQNVMNI